MASETPKGFVPGEYQGLTARKISEETCRKYHYQVGMDKQGRVIQIANYYDKQGQLIAQHTRDKQKNFKWIGRASEAGLFGQGLWRNGGKRIIVTEGEIDALSVAELLKTWPVVSIPNGAQSAKKTILKELEWLESYEEVVLCFDSDEPGIKAAQECAEQFSPGKCRIALLPLKDANEMWVKGLVRELTSALWEAKEYRPDGILCGNDPDLREHVVNYEPHMDAEYPWPELNAKLYGMRLGELVMHTAGTGIGKSTICREIAFDLGVRQAQKVGVIALEENPRRTALLLTSLAANRRLHLRSDGADKAERKAWFNATVGNGNFFFYDHWGSVGNDTLLAKIRYMIKSLGCRWIILDHLSIVVSDSDADDERKTIDRLMTKLRSLVEETKCGLHAISHLSRKHDGKSHEEGAAVSLRDLRGSHSIVQLSDIVLGYERNQQDEEHDCRMLVRVLKDRNTGETGLKGILEYDRDTGRVNEVPEGATDFHNELAPGVDATPF